MVGRADTCIHEKQKGKIRERKKRRGTVTTDSHGFSRIQTDKILPRKHEK
jgi:hypothetical protein